LTDYLDGELPEDERQAIQAHLATCAACRAESALLQEVDEAMVTWPVLAEPEGLADRVMETIRAGERRETAPRAHTHLWLQWRLRWQDALLGLALALTVAVLVLSIRHAGSVEIVESMAMGRQVQHSLSTIERELVRAFSRARVAARAEIKRDWGNVARVFGWASSGIVLLAGVATAILLVTQWPGETLIPFWDRRRAGESHS
jgi:hypothetical protein